jgi:tRNA nucleotidyltransferase/poly(A) polymerase
MGMVLDEINAMYRDAWSRDAHPEELQAVFNFVSRAYTPKIPKTAGSEEHARSIALMKYLSKVARRLGVSEHIYVVGGAVRNFLIDRPIKDIDVVVDSVSLGGRKDSAWFAKQLERDIPAMTNLTTNQYGVAILTIKGSWELDGVEMKGEVIEIANARKESYGGSGGKGYKPSEVVPATIEEDVVRREFTFNTLMWRLLDVANGPDKAEIIDLTGCGRRDLENREMRCPQDPDKVFADDPTRLMRAIKFVAKYGFKIPPDLAASIKRNAPKMKQAPWEAIGTLLVENVLKESTARSALKLMDSLGLLKVIAEMVQSSKPFQSYLAGQLRDQKVQVLLDLMDLGLNVRSPITFLSRDQQQRLREVTVGMPEGEAEKFLAVLKKPPINNMALITEFNIPKHERGTLAATAREMMLEEPNLASNPSNLQRAVERQIARQYRTASDLDGVLTGRVAARHIKQAHGRAEKLLKKHLRNDWPEDVLYELAEEYMWMEQRDTEPWSVRSVHMERMFESFYDRVERMDRRNELDQDSSWYLRYENGLEDEITKAIKKIEDSGAYRFASRTSRSHP